MADAVAAKSAEETPSFILGNSSSLRAIKDKILLAARHRDPVLILGEPGTGKDELARFYHESTGRKGAFIRVNCRALNATLGFSALFGHEKGAFTGANALRVGAFELANGGTIFLDEIGHLPQDLHGALIHTIQQRCFNRVGGQQLIRVDIRIVAATNVPLKQFVSQGKFPQDIYDRISQIEVELPPLRARGRDTAVILEHYWSEAQDKYGRPRRLAHEAKRLLLLHPWPGNVREMQKVTSTLVANSRGRRVDVQDVCNVLQLDPEEIPETLDARLDAELSEAPRSAAELMGTLHASQSSIARRLRRRRLEGQVKASRDGRRLFYTLSSEASHAEPPVGSGAPVAPPRRGLDEGGPADTHTTIEEAVLERLADGALLSPGELLRSIGADTTRNRKLLYRMTESKKLAAAGATRNRRYYRPDLVTSISVASLPDLERAVLASLQTLGPMSPAQVAEVLRMERWRARRALYRLDNQGVAGTGNTRRRMYHPPSASLDPAVEALSTPRAPP